MPNTYSWNIVAVDRRPSEGELSDVIYNVHWRYTADNGNDVTATIIGTQSVAAPDSENFIAYADVTEANVISWIEPEMDLTEMQSNLDAQVAEKVTPTSITSALGE
jgi:hypothetical protein